MRNVLTVAAGMCLMLAWAGRAAAQDDARAIAAKAVKASGGEERLAKLKVAKLKFKGTGKFEGNRAVLTGEIMLQLPRQLRMDVQAEVQGQTVSVRVVVNGHKAWLQVMGQTMALKDEELQETKEELYVEHIQSLVPLLKDKSFTLTPLGEVKVNGRDAVGIRVASEGHKEVNLYFDKATALLAKQERRTLDENDKEVTEETFYSGYKDVDGVKVPMKSVVHHDGQEFMEIEITEYQFLDRIDEGEFGRPGGGECAADFTGRPSTRRPTAESSISSLRPRTHASSRACWNGRRPSGRPA
jgi:outer membrane lipoprotein-sorting protein